MFGSKAGAYPSEAPFVIISAVVITGRKYKNVDIPEGLKGQEYGGI